MMCFLYFSFEKEKRSHSQWKSKNVVFICHYLHCFAKSDLYTLPFILQEMTVSECQFVRNFITETCQDDCKI